ncbi:ChaN family lipoprotein [Yokenella regensburgei]|uniref:ChaN family lipoprotein n=1 Tax=Yokenella regensburgei TaxID=158877 RepID=UPI003F15862C
MFSTDKFLRALVLSGTALLFACKSTSTGNSAIVAAAVTQEASVLEAATGEALTPQQLLERLGDAPMVIVGEEHINPHHHQIEQWLLQHLAARRPQGSVLMEMIDLSQQEGVNRVRQARLAGTPVSAARAAETMRWNPGWPWEMYRDVVMTAIDGAYPLLAANISRAQVNALYKNPTFPPGRRVSRPQVHEALSAIIYLMHGGQIEGEQVTAMMAVQQQRDRFMAEQLYRAPRPALLIAGGYHASKDIGVPLHLADLEADKPVVVMLTTQGTTLTAKQADYIWPVTATK